MPSWTRREILRATVAGSATAVAGCLSETPSESVATSSPADTPSPSPAATTESASRTATSSGTSVPDGEASPARSCRDGYHSIDPWWIVEGSGPLGGFDLTLDEDEISRDDILRARLTNVTDEERSTGTKQKFDIQYRAENGWHTIFGTVSEHAGYIDLAVLHEPGAGFEWELRFTRDGLSGTVDGHGELNHYACAPIESGTYRFVYWGITTERERRNDYETDYALGVPFTVSGT